MADHSQSVSVAGTVGTVVIGRNEGERLKACLRSVLDQSLLVVYVDSGSTDGSLEFAYGLGIAVVNLDLSQPFTAARARNAGFNRLNELIPTLQFVQFIDGDCLLYQNWLNVGVGFLNSNPKFAVVSGKVSESNRDGTVFNRLLDMEWNVPCGETGYCGGIALMRVTALNQVGGFNSQLVAGEEPELCVRLRQQGWRIMRLDAEMTQHDAAMTRFSQWWKRTKRGGFAYAYGSFLHGQPPERHWVRETRSAVIWGLVLPVAILLLALTTNGWGLLLALMYPLQVIRVARYRRLRGDSFSDSLLYGFFCVIAKFPEALGVLRFWSERLRGRQGRLIEYK